MNEIFKTKFVSLLSDTSVVANEEMQKDRMSTRLNSSHNRASSMPSAA